MAKVAGFPRPLYPPDAKEHASSSNGPDVAEAAERYRNAEAERVRAREELRTKVRLARDEGIPYAAIARAAGVSLERVRQIYAGK
jgi:DNA-directed RNA polymerase specialized sigma24 family protein